MECKTEGVMDGASSDNENDELTLA